MSTPFLINSNSSLTTARASTEFGVRTRARQRQCRWEEWWRSYGPPLVYGACCASRGVGSIPARDAVICI